MSAIAAVDSVRSLLTAGAPPDDAQAALALSCVVFDGITSPPLIRELTSDPRKCLMRMGEAGFLQVRCGENQIAYPLQSITLAFVPAALCTTAPQPWRKVAEKASCWLREKLPGFSWGKDAFGQLLQAEGHWLHLNIPSMLNTAAESAGDIAAMSLHSCARLAGEEVNVDPTARATERPRVAVVAAYSLDRLERAIHHWGDGRKNLGGDDARASGLEADLSEIDPGEAGSPFAAVHAWASQEVRSILSRVPNHIQNSTLSTYLSNVSKALRSLAPSEDLRFWGDDQWRDLLRVVRQLAGKKDIDAGADSLPAANRDPAFFRFGRALAAHGGYSVPEWILEPTRRRERGLVISAAAVHVGPEDFRKAEQTLRLWLEDEPWTLRRCNLLLKYLEDIPSRISEPITLLADCLTRDGQHLVLRPNGFNILKTSTSKRLIQVGDEFAASIRELVTFSRNVRASSKFLFLTDNVTTESAVEIVHLVRTALQEAVGDPNLVLHSTRASAIIRTIASGWDGVVSQVLQRAAGPAAAASLFTYQQAKWQVPALAASRAGHAERRTLVESYCAAWPLLRYLAMAGTLVDLKIGPTLLSFANLTPEALRKARSRSQQEGAFFDPWLWWAKRLPSADITRYQLAVPCAPEPQKLEQLHPEMGAPSVPAQTPLACKLRYVAKRHLGMDLDVAAASEGIGVREARLLEEAVRKARAFSGLTKRVKSTSSLRAKAADFKWIDLPDAVSWLSACDCFDEARLRALWSLLIGEARLAPDNSAAYIDLLTSATKVLPSGTTLEFVFGQRHHSAEVAGALVAEGAVVGRPHRDYGAQPRVFVVRSGQPRNDVEKARLTTMVRLLVCAFVCVKETE